MWSNLCRVCGKTSTGKNPINLFQTENKEILDKIKDLTGIRLKHNLDFPKLMCCVCKKDLEDAFSFREKFLKVQASFREKGLKGNKKQAHKSLIEATEFVQVFVFKEEKDITIEKHEDTYPEDEEKEINIVNSDDLKKNHNIYKDSNNEVNALELKPNEEYVFENTQIVREEAVCSRNDITIDASKIVSGNDDKESEDEYKPETETLLSETSVRNRKSKKSNCTIRERENNDLKSNKKRKGSEEHSNIFICDQCGNHFNCSNHFKLHLRRHTGDKRCACELCPDKFFTSSELRRHMRRHTGERPFACKYCERRFTDYSTRIKHERTHTNERPFMCAQCGKSFTTSYILKNHMLTHTGERQFRCEVCNRAFTRRTHLVVHFRSIMHKQAVEKVKRPISLEGLSHSQCLIQQPTPVSTFTV